LSKLRHNITLFNPRPNRDLKPLDLPLSLLCVSRFLDEEGYECKIVSENLFEDLMEVSKYCTLGQITNALFEVGGKYRRNM